MITLRDILPGEVIRVMLPLMFMIAAGAIIIGIITGIHLTLIGAGTAGTGQVMVGAGIAGMDQIMAGAGIITTDMVAGTIITTTIMLTIMDQEAHAAQSLQEEEIMPAEITLLQEEHAVMPQEREITEPVAIPPERVRISIPHDPTTMLARHDHNEPEHKRHIRHQRVHKHRALR